MLIAFLLALVTIAPEAPLASDLNWLPPKSLAHDNMTLSVKFYTHCKNDPLDWWETEESRGQLLEAADYCSDVWIALYEAHTGAGWTTDDYTRHELDKLRTLVGWNRYYSAQLIAPIPFWLIPRNQ